MSFVRKHQKVLILADEPMAAALIATLVERARLQPAFADTGESADEALARTKPMLGILIDALTNTSQSDLFLARARSRNVSVALFCEVSQKARQLEWASAHRIPVFGLPTDTDALHAWRGRRHDRFARRKRREVVGVRSTFRRPAERHDRASLRQRCRKGTRLHAGAE